MSIDFRIRPARQADLPALRRLLPRLADFDIPATRVAEDLWRVDEQLIARALAGDEPACHVHVAVDSAGDIIGVSSITLAKELLAQTPSAHLEALAVSKMAQGNGVGSALLANVERCARDLGAQSVTLSVFRNNKRARRVYEKAGFDSELIRCIKWLEPPTNNE